MENNYVFKDSAPNTIENAYFDNPQPKIPFRMRIKERMHTTKPMIIMGAANLLIILVTGLVNFAVNMIFENQEYSYITDYSETAITDCIIDFVTVLILVMFGFLAYKKFIGMLKFAGCYTAAALVAKLFVSLGDVITLFVVDAAGTGDFILSKYYTVSSILSVIALLVTFGLSILFTRLLIRKG